MKNFKVPILLSVLLIVSTVTAAEKLLISGSATIGPLSDAFAELFKSKCDITVNKTGSDDGAKSLIAGSCDIAMMTRFMKDAEFKTAVEKGIMPVAHVIAMNGICFIVHPSNQINNLTCAQIRDIYLGNIKNWKDLGGADLPIIAINRDSSSSAFELFNRLIMKNEETTSCVEMVSSVSPQAHARVTSTQGAIAYVGHGFVDKEVKALKIDGVMPSHLTIAKGIYPASCPLYLFTNGYPKPGTMVNRFCTFYLTEEGQEMIESKGFIPVTNY